MIGPNLLQSGETQPSVAEQLNASRGVVDLGDYIALGLDPNRPILLTQLASTLGLALAAEPRKNDMTDQPLDVHRDDFSRVQPEALGTGLYVPPTDPRYQMLPRLVIVSGEPCSLSLIGVQPRRTGVVFSPGEFKKVARSAPDLVRAVRTKTIDANEANADREEVDERNHRTAADVMMKQLEGMGELNARLIGQRLLSMEIYRQARLMADPVTVTKKLDVKRKDFDELLHSVVEVASVALELGTTAVNANHRSVASNLYRRGSSTDITHWWQAYSTLVGRYANARRGKIDQSQKACREQLKQYAPYLRDSLENTVAQPQA